METRSFCPHCGARRAEWAKFCGGCGKAYDGGPAEAPAADAAGPALGPETCPNPRCRAKQLVRDRGYCLSCGKPYATGQAAAEAATRAGPPPTSAATLAGVAWILCGAMTGYLGWLQISVAGSPLVAGSPTAGQLGAAGVWNAVAAALSILFGSLLVARPSRGLLGASVFWGVLTVAWNGWNIANGVTHWAYIGATVAALVGGIVALTARQQWAEGA